MTDSIIQAIKAGEIHNANISFDLIRNIAGRDRDCWDELGRGRAILFSQEQLDQYLYSYGPMTKSQWSEFLREVALPPGAVRIVDYGCGQGLACALLFDQFGSSITDRVQKAVLIEPSSIALSRAKAIVACYCDNAALVAVNKRLDDVSPQELEAKRELSTIHLFSNVLDIKDFDHEAIFTAILKTKGRHCVLAISHDRNFGGGSARFEEAERLVIDSQDDDIIVAKSAIKRFTCSNGQDAISWQLHLEVLRGPL